MRLNRWQCIVNIIEISLKNNEQWSIGDLEILTKAIKVGVGKRNFEPYSATILTNYAPFSSIALNFRYIICGQRGGTVMLISSDIELSLKNNEIWSIGN